MENQVTSRTKSQNTGCLFRTEAEGGKIPIDRGVGIRTAQRDIAVGPADFRAGGHDQFRAKVAGISHPDQAIDHVLITGPGPEEIFPHLPDTALDIHGRSHRPARGVDDWSTRSDQAARGVQIINAETFGQNTRTAADLAEQRRDLQIIARRVLRSPQMQGAFELTVKGAGTGRGVGSAYVFSYRKVDKRSGTKIKERRSVGFTIDRAACLEGDMTSLAGIAELFRGDRQGNGLDFKRIILGKSGNGFFDGQNPRSRRRDTLPSTGG